MTMTRLVRPALAAVWGLSLAFPTPLNGTDLLWDFEFSPGHCFRIAVAPAGDRFAVATGTPDAQIHDVLTGSLVGTLRGHQGAIVGIAYSTDGTMLATAGEDAAVRLWRLPEDEMLRVLPTGSSGMKGVARFVQFSPDGQWLITPLFENSGAASLAVWRTADGTLTRRLAGNSGWTSAGLFLPASPNTLATVGGYRGLDTNIRLFDVVAGATTGTVPTSNAYGARDCALDGRGGHLAVGTDEYGHFAGQVEVFGLADWKRRAALPTKATAVAFSPDGGLLATAWNGKIQFWDWAAGRVVAEYSPAKPGALATLAFTPDGRRLVVGGTRTAQTGSGTQLLGRLLALSVPVRIRVGATSGNRLSLEWSGGLGTRRLQWASSPAGPWFNVVTVGDSTGAEVAAEATARFFRAAAEP